MEPTTQPAAEQAGMDRRRERPKRTGIVVSAGGHKTIVVQCEYLTRHDKYGKYMRRRTRVSAHDEKNEAKTGDRVELMMCRPVSKTKSWRLVRVLEDVRLTGTPQAATSGGDR